MAKNEQEPNSNRQYTRGENLWLPSTTAHEMAQQNELDQPTGPTMESTIKAKVNAWLDKPISKRQLTLGFAMSGLAGALINRYLTQRDSDSKETPLPLKGKYLAPLQGFEHHPSTFAQGDPIINTHFIIMEFPVPFNVDFAQEQTDFMILNKPAVISFSPGRIPFFSEPSFESIKIAELEVGAIKAKQAAPVSGDLYLAGVSNQKWGTSFRPYRANVIYNDKIFAGGQWHMLVDRKGEKIDPAGNLIEGGQDNFYTPTAFVRVQGRR